MKKTKLIPVLIIGACLACFGMGILYDQRILDNNKGPEPVTAFENGSEIMTFPVYGNVSFGTDGNNTFTLKIQGIQDWADSR